MSILYSYKCLDSWIRQEYIGSEANVVYNSCASRNDHRNSKGGIE